jgi:hypothetical protein
VMKKYLLASDFDQTLSFNDSGIALSELLGIPGFREKVARLSRLNLVQQGGELAYLPRHDPEYRRVRKQDLTEVGRRVRLKRNICAAGPAPRKRNRGLSLRLLRGLGGARRSGPVRAAGDCAAGARYWNSVPL